MKINEKTLIKYATNNRDIDKEGYLFKRGEINRSFQKRWCVLKGNLFYYFEKKGDKEPIGCIVLEGSRVEIAENETELFSFHIVFIGPGTRCYVLGTDTQENMESWMKALSCASHHYLKMIVAELQRQLDEINDHDRKRLMQQSLLANTTAAGVKPVRINPFDSDSSDLMGFSQDAVNCAQNNIFTRRPFVEIHEQYGRQFRTYFNNREQKDKADLIDLS
ncbi:sesquipedalian-1-like protein [Dinothrombium tinctorium]|uniref:Sesquipedalian-1-like protein n=1 Tax=Dinothrombium tinctorium TaxID=1965070 RepID=A0A443RA12_9ACAR|nr:sesquipedalian-1-like protein [Dinothrombium tinctorium]